MIIFKQKKHAKRVARFDRQKVFTIVMSTNRSSAQGKIMVNAGQ
jgi:hypothetical protein